MSPDLRETSHRRLNPLRGDWVVVSPHRTQRPWQGRREAVATDAQPRHDPGCYLCAGNLRANGARNPDYRSTFAFDNDFAALKSDAGDARFEDGLMVAEAESGVCRVICFSPRHDLTLARMGPAGIVPVVEAFVAQARELGARADVRSVQAFENRGEIMGCSNPHPHGQVWASRHEPNELVAETASQAAHFARHGRPMLADYLARELALGERIVFENECFACLVPFWATWPFETMLLPKRPLGALDDLDAGDVAALAAALSELTIRYDNLFETSFPYSMGFHQRPADGAPHPEWTLHAHFYPPLLRSASVKKFMVGFEMLGSPQRDITPEAAAGRLRALPATHYLDRAAPAP
ncbi:MAG: UDP-glucose--hexose-1-phosphate uridylyltransferase [Hyphomicrobiales bacterium]|nr:UDP-glucose--hexose-1-phosphate uridylyltransferase [Hyphomicrobiales bacterium]MDE2018021.1 UDP-glucose--hexose-1-phosphate uridylyltransferase [Hyphomicrobiales bacterium]